jgi:hypothetical protein
MEPPAGGDSVIFCWKHSCDPFRIQLTRVETTNCILCGTSSSELVMVAQIARPDIAIDLIECDIVVASSTWHSGTNVDDKLTMHIGVCDSRSRVLEFDKAGLLFDERPRIDAIWLRCLRLDFLKQIGLDAPDDMETAKRFWDEAIRWLRDDVTLLPYHDTSNNCLDFIQMFLRKFLELVRGNGRLSKQQADELHSCTSNKVEFCQKFILQKTKQLARYITLDRRLKAGKNFLPSR